MSKLIKAIASSNPIEYIVVAFASILLAVPFINISLALRELPASDLLAISSNSSASPLYSAPTTALIFIAISLVLLFLFFRTQLR